MPELRKDYILDRWVLISEKRSKRPKQFKHTYVKKGDFDYFCPGNESNTPPEIGRIIDNKGNWKIRWFPNKFPAVDQKGPTYGFHEIIVEGPSPKKQLEDMSKDHILQLLKIYADRIKELSSDKKIKYVLVLKNAGSKAGTSLIHPHAQVIAYDKVPELVKEEANKSKKAGKCGYCKVIKKEAKAKRIAKENKSFVAICPYASRFNYEVWVFPKKHIKSMEEFDDQHFSDLAAMMKSLLKRITSITDSYNFYLHYSPKEKDLHFHIEICPRISTWAGFELGTGEIINSVSPETAARFYRR